MAYTIGITSAPGKQFSPAYRPVIFDVTGSCDASGEAIVSVRADIYKDGVYLVSQRSNFPQFVLNGTTKTYSIEFDLQQTIQDSFEAEFLNAQHGYFNVKFTAEQYNTGSKYLEDTTANVTSADFFAVNATLQHYQVQDLDTFYGAGFKLATNCPNVITGTPSREKIYRFLRTNRTSKAYTSFLFKNATAITFDIVAKFYDSDFKLLGSKTTTSASSHSGNDFIPVDVSAAAVDPESAFLNAAYYTVQIIYGGNSSDIHGYKIETCTPELTVHFLNQYGGYDTYNFWHLEDDYTTKSAQFERPLPSTFDRQARGFISTQQTANSELKVTADKLTPDWLVWLKELISSADVYYEKTIAGAIQALPATVKDGTSVVYNSDQGAGTLTLSLIPSNEMIGQRN